MTIVWTINCFALINAKLNELPRIPHSWVWLNCKDAQLDLSRSAIICSIIKEALNLPSWIVLYFACDALLALFKRKHFLLFITNTFSSYSLMASCSGVGFWSLFGERFCSWKKKKKKKSALRIICGLKTGGVKKHFRWEHLFLLLPYQFLFIIIPAFFSQYCHNYSIRHKAKLLIPKQNFLWFI